MMSNLCSSWFTFLPEAVDLCWKNREEALFIDTAHQNRSIVLTLESRYRYTNFLLWGYNVIGYCKVTDRNNCECKFCCYCCAPMSHFTQDPSGFMQNCFVVSCGICMRIVQFMHSTGTSNRHDSFSFCHVLSDSFVLINKPVKII